MRDKDTQPETDNEQYYDFLPLTHKLSYSAPNATPRNTDEQQGALSDRIAQMRLQLQIKRRALKGEAVLLNPINEMQNQLQKALYGSRRAQNSNNL